MCYFSARKSFPRRSGLLHCIITNIEQLITIFVKTDAFLKYSLMNIYKKQHLFEMKIFHKIICHRHLSM